MSPARVATAWTRLDIAAELSDYLDRFAGLAFLEDEQVLDRRGRPMSLGEATMLKYRTDYDRVGETYLSLDYSKVTRVSTVWLGPIYPFDFETMIFSDVEVLDERQWRWPTLRSAEIGHRQIVREVKGLLHQPVALPRPHRHGRW